MIKKKKNIDLVITFLEQECKRLKEEIIAEKGSSNDKIKLKDQMQDVLANLKLFSDREIYPDKFELIEIPEGGSDAYFTEFYIVDEGGINNVPEWAIKKNNDGAILLNSFDLILRKKD